MSLKKIKGEKTGKTIKQTNKSIKMSSKKQVDYLVKLGYPKDYVEKAVEEGRFEKIKKIWYEEEERMKQYNEGRLMPRRNEAYKFRETDVGISEYTGGTMEVGLKNKKWLKKQLKAQGLKNAEVILTRSGLHDYKIQVYVLGKKVYKERQDDLIKEMHKETDIKRKEAEKELARERKKYGITLKELAEKKLKQKGNIETLNIRQVKKVDYANKWKDYFRKGKTTYVIEHEFDEYAFKIVGQKLIKMKESGIPDNVIGVGRRTLKERIDGELYEDEQIVIGIRIDYSDRVIK